LHHTARTESPYEVMEVLFSAACVVVCSYEERRNRKRTKTLTNTHSEIKELPPCAKRSVAPVPLFARLL
jgi:hypothetical protein